MSAKAKFARISLHQAAELPVAQAIASSLVS
jgi:hypothetical protein